MRYKQHDTLVELITISTNTQPSLLLNNLKRLPRQRSIYIKAEQDTKEEITELM